MAESGLRYVIRRVQVLPPGYFVHFSCRHFFQVLNASLAYRET